MDPRGPSYTYAVRCAETGRFKIGQSHTPAQRLRQLQTMSPTRLLWVGLLMLSERDAHEMLSPHRMHGEWFADNDHVCAVISDFALHDCQWPDAKRPGCEVEFPLRPHWLRAA